MISLGHDISERGTSHSIRLCILPLRLSDFRLLIPLGHDVSESGTSDGSHELLSSPRSLLSRLFDHAFAVLATVQDRPVDLSKRE